MENDRKPIGDEISHHARNDDLTGLCSLMNAGSNIDAIAAQHAVVINDILDIDADPQAKSERVRFAIDALQRTLDIAGPPDRAHYTRELRQYAISSQIGNSPPVAVHKRLNDLGPQRLPTAHGFDIIERHQTRIAGDVGKSDCNESPVDR
jgi:hypothetical protein